ncbi:GNAT family N-acetyltransferase [Kibdelosporangium aridum]|uniref:GNAT family N-acetyltransferase n=1 Tax=Kibdelosporangium aridum TaxID=2030 RepID=UPI0035E4E3C3
MAIKCAVEYRQEFHDDPLRFYGEHADELTAVCVDAFGRPADVLRDEVTERFARTSLVQIIRGDGRVVGFGLYAFVRAGAVELLSVEGRAIAREHQRRGLGVRALQGLLEVTDASMIASVTRSPAIPKLMKHAFYTILPDLSALNPFHPVERHDVREAAECYARYAGADPVNMPPSTLIDILCDGLRAFGHAAQFRHPQINATGRERRRDQ